MNLAAIDETPCFAMTLSINQRLERLDPLFEVQQLRSAARMDDGVEHTHRDLLSQTLV